MSVLIQRQHKNGREAGLCIEFNSCLEYQQWIHVRRQLVLAVWDEVYKFVAIHLVEGNFVEFNN